MSDSSEPANVSSNLQSQPDSPAAGGESVGALPLNTGAGAPRVRSRELWHRFFDWNPLFLISAALLLYSCYLVSMDRAFFATEVSQLSFNLSSLQLYEGLLVLTAVYLARRAIWYDSTLLVGLENLLALVPFILISQAALINMRLVWVLCLAGGALVAVRAALLKRLIPPLNAPARLLGLGAVILVANSALPIVYRILQESKFGTKPDWGAAYWTNQFVWWLLVPALCALGAWVPCKPGRFQLWPQRRWLPLALFSLWLTGTAVHLYCLDYVYDFELRPELVAPAIWMLLWVVYVKAASIQPDLSESWRHAFWIAPALATSLAAPQPGKQVFLALTLLNVAIYGGIYTRERRRVALHLLLISVTALLAGLPEEWGRHLSAGFSREKFVGAAAAVYALGWIARSRDAKLGLLGAFVAATFTSFVAPEETAFHWAVEAGLAFLLLHSLRWVDSRAEGTVLVRWIVALVWVAHALTWTHVYGAAWRPSAIALPVLVVYLVIRWLEGRWAPLVVLLAALVVLLSAPTHSAAVQIQAAPAGLLAALGSFLLFGCGTLLAILRPKLTLPPSQNLPVIPTETRPRPMA